MVIRSRRLSTREICNRDGKVVGVGGEAVSMVEVVGVVVVVVAVVSELEIGEVFVG